jgi:hypothetical protein
LIVGHVDARCKEEYNPYTVQKEMGFEKINSPVCEQVYISISGDMGGLRT